MKKLIALILSDLHWNDWEKHNENDKRIKATGKILSNIMALASISKVKVLFPGDLFHKPKQLSNKLLWYSLPYLKGLMDNAPNFLAITGNHDADEFVNGRYTYSYIKTLSKIIPNFYCIDYSSGVLSNNVMVFGIPFLQHNIGFNKELEKVIENRKRVPKEKAILMIHTDLHGAKDTDGRLVKSVTNIPKNLDEYFGDFDLVISGHIHKPQILTSKVLMVGATNQQRVSDMGCEMGYWELYDDLSYEFKPLKTPQFREYLEGEEHEDTKDFWMEVPKEDKVEIENKQGFSKGKSREQLAENYLNIKNIKTPSKRVALKKILKNI